MQRLLATAGVVMLASLVPAIAPDDRPSATHNTTAHDSAPRREARLIPEIAATEPTQVEDTKEDTAADAASAAADVEADIVADAAPPRVVPLMDTLAARLPSLAALDAAFDVPEFPALAALDAAFDNRPVQLPPVPIPSRRPPTYAEMCETLASAASAHSLPTPFMIRLIWQESRFRHNVISHAGAQGIAQFMPETANLMGLDDPFDPLEALPVSARFLRKLIERFGNIGLAAAAYNAGPKRVLDWLAGKGELPKETQDYVKTITGQPAEKWRKPEATAELPRVPSRAPCQREAGLYAANGPDHIPLPPDMPFRNPERTLLAAVDEAPAAADKSKIAKSETKSGTKPETKSAAKSDTKPDAKPAKAERKSVQLAAMRKARDDAKDSRTDGKKDAKIAAEAATKTAAAETKSLIKIQTKSDRKNPDKKAGETSGAKRDKKPDAKPAGKSDRKSASKPAGKTAAARPAAAASGHHAAKAAKKFATADAR
jgi:soluble lytic murein transglycosylase-like protein